MRFAGTAKYVNEHNTTDHDTSRLACCGPHHKSALKGSLGRSRAPLPIIRARPTRSMQRPHPTYTWSNARPSSLSSRTFLQALAHLEPMVHLRVVVGPRRALCVQVKFSPSAPHTDSQAER